jgi:hypothetical protein|tara:strand:+ start:504 stop:638 length:135 start_codon:yes stop_codon:yes gene_type:complete
VSCYGKQATTDQQFLIKNAAEELLRLKYSFVDYLYDPEANYYFE